MSDVQRPRRTWAIRARTAAAIASIMTPARAPCRSSPVSSRMRKSCSSAVVVSCTVEGTRSTLTFPLMEERIARALTDDF